MLTTGLLSGARYVKDNRPLPRGFDKTTASDDIAVRGEASADPNFGSAGDQLRYVLDLPTAPGPLTIGVELRYQPIGYRWAQNLGGYDARGDDTIPVLLRRDGGRLHARLHADVGRDRVHPERWS